MEIYNKEVNDSKLNEIILIIKKKKELMYLDSSYILHYIKKILEQNTKLITTINNSNKLDKNKDIKTLIKEIRDKAHSVYGMFQSPSIKNREELLTKLKEAFKNKEENDSKNKEKNDDKILSIYNELLKTHISTKERIEINLELYNKIFSLTKKPASILDLGCGLNPLTLPFMNLDKIKYIASDFNQEDMDFLNKYFKLLPTKQKGIAIKLDLLKDHDKLTEYDVDICFLFKTLDSLESIQKNISYNVIKSIKAKFIIVSFPLKTLSGRREMKLKKRNWFEKVCNRTEWNFETFEMDNELFYVLNR